MSNTLYILVGAPGKGRDAAALRLLGAPDGSGSSGGVVMSPYDAFYEEGGAFRFDSLLMPMAHAACCERMGRAMKNGTKKIVIKFGHFNLHDLHKYIDIATDFRYNIHVEQYVEGVA